ncbi:CDF family Co(II)/Ni(II) efflux transporter DmeF [soil metagenome]
MNAPGKQRHDHSPWQHDHSFHAPSEAAERGTRQVVWITVVMMVIEIAAGYGYNSMALLADGWHMSSHALAIGLSALAYAAARRYASDGRFAFGTWKIEVLASFASAIVLLGIAGMMIYSSVERLFTPAAIHYQEALAVGVLGLLVNLVCAFLLARAGQHDHHGHDHGHGHGGQHGKHHEDLNLKSAYIHVLADAATSVLAIGALLAGWLWGLAWLDPVVGIGGAILVAVWAFGLLRQTGAALLDREMDHPVVAEIRELFEPDHAAHGTSITDLHVWRVGRQAYACAMSLVTHDAALTPAAVRQRLAVHEEIVHVTVEIAQCEG